VRLVEDDDAVEAAAEPVDELREARRLALALGGAQGGVGNEQDAAGERDRLVLLPQAERLDVARAPPTAIQSRRASSISLSDLEIQTARRRPRSQWSRRIAATCRPLPAPVPSPRNQPRRNRTASASASSAADTTSQPSSTR
jgi:hypothetical protein